MRSDKTVILSLVILLSAGLASADFKVVQHHQQEGFTMMGQAQEAVDEEHVTWIGDKKRIARDHRNVQAMIYSLSLAVYCTSWTFYGAVGSAATTGWGFLPIYVGPALLMLVGQRSALLKYLKNTSIDRYSTLCEGLGIRA